MKINALRPCAQHCSDKYNRLTAAPPKTRTSQFDRSSSQACLKTLLTDQFPCFPSSTAAPVIQTNLLIWACCFDAPLCAHGTEPYSWVTFPVPGRLAGVHRDGKRWSVKTIWIACWEQEEQESGNKVSTL